MSTLSTTNAVTPVGLTLTQAQVHEARREAAAIAADDPRAVFGDSGFDQDAAFDAGLLAWDDNDLLVDAVDGIPV